jgi:Domain of unknown function (DUF6538)
MLWTTRMSGLVKRGGVYIFRRRVPHRLREVIGTHEVKCSLGTGDLKVAHVRWTVKKAEVDRLFAEAEKSLVNPSVAAYKVVSTHTWSDPDAEWALDAHLTEDHHVGITPAVRDALLDRQKDSANNPPLSVVFSRYCEERNLPVKTQQEWANVVARFTEVIGGDVPIQSVTPAHVRSFKSSLLTTISERTGLVPAPATVVKLLASQVRSQLRTLGAVHRCQSCGGHALHCEARSQDGCGPWPHAVLVGGSHQAVLAREPSAPYKRSLAGQGTRARQQGAWR